MDGLTETATLTRSNLVNGDFPLVHKPFTILSGRSLLRGAVLGLVLLGAPTVEADEGNTGGGTLTLAETPLGSLAQLGDYAVKCIAEAANGGTFAVFAPDGTRLADAVVGVAYVSDHVNFTIADVGEDFDVDDLFTITVPAGSGKAVKCVKTAVDGSQRPVAILAEPVDATEEDVEGPGYVSGQFDPTELDLTGTGFTAATLAAAFRDKPIFLRASTGAPAQG
ncbi:head decoration protein [Parvibaculum sp.]|uniref:head decoration protein n=1 Tax=Parvibaculum sp. TaxID=2024848 RepID=UPI00391A81EE